MEMIVQVFLMIIEISSLTFLTSAFFKRKNIKCTYLAVSAVVCILLGILITFFPFTADKLIIKMFFAVLIYHFTVNTAFEGKNTAKFIVAIIGMGMVYVLDYIVIAVSVAALGKTPTELLAYGSINIFISLISKLTLLTICIIIDKHRKLKNEGNNISFLEWLQILIFPIVSLSMIFVLLEEVLISNNVGGSMIFSALGIAVANIAIFIIIDKVDSSKKLKEEYILLQQKIELEMNTVNVLMQSYSQQRKITHDFTNHLQIISQLCSEKNTDALSEYVENIRQLPYSVKMIINTNNPIIDALLNYKYAIAHEKNIELTFFINDLKELPIKNEDLVVLLSNAIDNAIEACEKIEYTSKRNIFVKIAKEKQHLLIVVKNSIYGQIKTNLQTTKKNKLRHGFGLRNITGILQKYNAEPIITYDDTDFQLMAIIADI